MYLGMTESDYQSVVKTTPQLVAKRLHIPDAEVQDNSRLNDLIEQKDPAAFLIMREFLETYKNWWQSSNETTENFDQLRRLITSRDEIRNALISYLNAKYSNS
jgi:hypothetical protein